MNTHVAVKLALAILDIKEKLPELCDKQDFDSASRIVRCLAEIQSRSSLPASDDLARVLATAHGELATYLQELAKLLHSSFQRVEVNGDPFPTDLVKKSLHALELLGPLGEYFPTTEGISIRGVSLYCGQLFSAMLDVFARMTDRAWQVCGYAQ